MKRINNEEVAMRPPGRTAAGWVLAVVAVALLALAPGASASLQPVDFFGSPPGGEGDAGGEFESSGAVAVNDSGAGPANAGDAYVIDNRNNRVQRFGRDDSGTPADTRDDTYFFVSAWGADVVRPGGAGDLGDAEAANYEICTVAEQCKAAVASPGNGTPVGNGSLGEYGFLSGGIAVDQDTGEVFVSDTANHRVNVYDGEGVFLRSFGNSVAEAGSPGDVAAPDEVQTLTVKAEGGKFSLEFEGKTTGARFAPRGSVSVNAGSKLVAVSGVLSGAPEVGQGFSAVDALGTNRFPRGTTITAIEPETLTVSEQAFDNGIAGLGRTLLSHDLDHDSTAAEVEAALNALPTIGGAGGSVSVTGGPGDPSGSSPYTIAFDGGSLAGSDVPQLETTGANLTSVGTPEATVETAQEGGAYEVCVAADGDVCRSGSAGSGEGALGEGIGLAVSPLDGFPSTGKVFVADAFKHRVATYDLDGSGPGTFGSSAEFGIEGSPSLLTVDSRGIVYVYSSARRVVFGVADHRVERYDTENANGDGTGFLAPILEPFDEVQRLTYKSVTGGQFRLHFDPDGSGPQPPEATSDIDVVESTGAPVALQVKQALEALPSIGAGDVNVRSNGGSPGRKEPFSQVTFSGSLAATDVTQLSVSAGSTPFAGSISVATEGDGHDGSFDDLQVGGLAVDPDSDGAGPDSDVLYAVKIGGTRVVSQLGPANAPGLSSPPESEDDRHGTISVFDQAGGLAVEPSTERLYVPGRGTTGEADRGVFVLGEASPTAPTATLDSLSGITATSIEAEATIDPNGPPPSSYRFEYSADEGASWESQPTTGLGSGEDPVAVTETIQGPPAGLDPATEYRVRVVVKRKFAPAVVSNELTATTLSAPPIAHTTGAPVRTTTSARLTGRVLARNSATEYRFEYGSEGPCGSNPCDSTPVRGAGSGDSYALVAEQVEGLNPGTTYHYRLVADNGTGGEVSGGEMTVGTRASDELAGQSDEYPGPPGSDRAWEMVSPRDSGGNPVAAGLAFSDGGDRAVYSIAGGTPLSNSGSFFSLYYSERPAGPHPTAGWRPKLITPAREDLDGADWQAVFGADDLSKLAASNDLNSRGPLWRLEPAAEPRLLYKPTSSHGLVPLGVIDLPFATSGDGERVVAYLRGLGVDPAHPDAGAAPNYYDITSDPPRLVSLLPGGEAAACGAEEFAIARTQAIGWISADGSQVYFRSKGHDCAATAQLYVRDIGAGDTALVSGPPVSGPSCRASLVKGVPGAAIFTTPTRLVPEDSEPVNGCASGKDIYRYDLADGGLECLTCIAPGVATEVFGTDATDISVAEDGSRIYFQALTPLLPGGPGVYRLDVETGNLALIPGLIAGDLRDSVDFSSDGALVTFISDAPVLDPLGGAATNGGSPQFYLYDDRDGSLTCVSCPRDGSAPLEGVSPAVPGSYGGGQPNITALAQNGTFAFATTTSLVGGDQNTPAPEPEGSFPYEAGADVYEWRDGRVLLVTDGLTSWPTAPQVSGISPTGRDIYFLATARLTADAPDGNSRLYDARIGGGIDLPKESPPCPLEVCQGTPEGAPRDPSPASIDFRGAGNVEAGPANCGAAARRARREARRAKRHSGRARTLRRRAARSSAATRSRALRRGSRRLAKRARRHATTAKRLRKRVRRCRVANARRVDR